MQTAGIDPLVGKFVGEYQVEQLLGHGELSTVYVAQHPVQNRKVMVIMFNPPEGFSAQERQRFTSGVTQEGATLVRLKHPNILPTYDFGELSGRPYLVAALVQGTSLKLLLKQQGRFTPQQTLSILRKTGTALDYAHSSGVVHGLLSLSNIMISQEFGIQIINFGTRIVVESHRQHENEWSVDARSDIYALGIILFELLSGTSPFGGAGSSSIAPKRLTQPLPYIHEQYPDVPQMLDVIISKMVGQDPGEGYQRASDIIIAFERVLQAVEAVSGGHTAQLQQLAQITLPGSVNWFDEPTIFPDKGEGLKEWGQIQPSQHAPTITSSDIPAEMRFAKDGGPSGANSSSDLMAGVNPLDRWSVTDAALTAQQSQAGTFMKRPSVGLATPLSNSRRRSAQQGRRQVVSLLAAGTAGAFILGGMNLLQHMQQPPAQTANVSATNGPTSSNAATNTPAKGNTSATQPKKGTQNTPTTPTSQPKPTQMPGGQPPPPQPTPPPPAHTGTVIGSTNQAVNSAQSFTNPADGQASLLVHLPNGNFVASESACTHEGVAVRYNAGTQKFVCPAHGANFDPANGFSYVPGSFSHQLNPLTAVSIRVNADGTVTTG